MTHVIDGLIQDHRKIESLLLVLEQELAVFDRRERPDYEVLQTLIAFFDDFAASSHDSTERLFFSVLKACDAEAAAMLVGFEDEHSGDPTRLRRLASLLANILNDREVPRHSFDEAVRDFIHHVRHEIDFEERVLFPAAMKAFEPRDWRSIEAELAAPAASHGLRQQKLHELGDRILHWESENQMART
jgi:hemerythrin-like domain-containing protein